MLSSSVYLRYSDFRYDQLARDKMKERTGRVCYAVRSNWPRLPYRLFSRALLRRTMRRFAGAKIDGEVKSPLSGS